jgi:hypothetical protein
MSRYAASLSRLSSPSSSTGVPTVDAMTSEPTCVPHPAPPRRASRNAAPGFLCLGSALRGAVTAIACAFLLVGAVSAPAQVQAPVKPQTSAKAQTLAQALAHSQELAQGHSHRNSQVKSPSCFLFWCSESISYLGSITESYFDETPVSIAADAAGNVFVIFQSAIFSGQNDPNLYEIPASCPTCLNVVLNVTAATGGYPPNGVAVDAAGNLYLQVGWYTPPLGQHLTNGQATYIVELPYNAATGTYGAMQTFCQFQGTPLDGNGLYTLPGSIKVDSASPQANVWTVQNPWPFQKTLQPECSIPGATSPPCIFVAIGPDNIDENCLISNPLGADLSIFVPYGVAVDTAGDQFFSIQLTKFGIFDDSSVWELPPSTNIFDPTFVDPPWFKPTEIALDYNNNLYVIDGTLGSLLGGLIPLGAGFGIGTAGNGRSYLAGGIHCTHNLKIRKLVRSTVPLGEDERIPRRRGAGELIFLYPVVCRSG